MIILDTNVLSEATRISPEPNVLRWWRSQPASRLFTTSVTRAELLYGAYRMPDGKRKIAVLNAIHTLFDQEVKNQMLSFDRDAAEAYAEIASTKQSMGKQIGVLDAQIAAITKVHGAKLATRNTRDFIDCGIELINPWETSPSPSGECRVLTETILVVG